MTAKMSTQELGAFPLPATLKKRCIAIAILEMIMDPEGDPQESYFTPDWGDDEQVFIWDNMSGDSLKIGFCKSGVLINGHDHERVDRQADVSEIFDSVPESLAGFRDEPAFDPENTTYCIWWQGAWKVSPFCAKSLAALEVSSEQLDLLNFNSSSYVEYADYLYDTKIDEELVNEIYQGKPLTKELIKSINEDANCEDVIAFAQTCQYGS